jgi:flagellar biosynthesis chaperone FliJ
MTGLPSHIQGHRETMQSRETARQENAERVWAEVEAERRAVDELTARLRAMRLARENTIS